MSVNQGPQGGVPPYSGGYPAQGGGNPAYVNAYPSQNGGVPPYGGGYPPQQGGFPPPPPQKKPVYKRVWFWIIVAVVVMALIGSLTGGNDSSSESNGATSAPRGAATSATEADETEIAAADEETEADNEPTLVLHATATGNGSVVWGSDGSTNTEEFTGEWSKTLTGEEATGYYSLFVSGDFMAGDDQEMTCDITKNGKQVDSSKGTGSAGSASCTTLG